MAIPLMGEIVLFITFFLGVVWAQRPSRYFFFGDSWDVLYLCMVDLRTALQPHNEHFIPLFKLFFHLQHIMFGAHHLAYMLVLYLLHSLAAVLVYRVAKQGGLPTLSSLAAALIFAFTSVTWEVTTWEFEQAFVLGTVFLLVALEVFMRSSRCKRDLLIVSFLLLLGIWSGGPIILSLSLALSAYLVTQDNRSQHSLTQLLFSLISLWTPLLIYYISLKLSLRLVANLDVNHVALNTPHIHLRSFPTMLDFCFYGIGWGVVLPTLTFIHAGAMVSATLILIILAISAAASYSTLLAPEKRFLWLLAGLIFFNYWIISIGRIVYGPATAASSRYQYLSTAPLAILLVLCWRGLWRKAVLMHPIWYSAISSALLLYLLVFHCATLKRENPGADRGLAVQRFLQLAIRSTFPAGSASGEVVLGPELLVPTEVYRPRTMPLWKILQVLQGSTKDVVPVREYVGDVEHLRPYNLITNGGFESGMGPEWIGFSGTQFHATAGEAHSGRLGAQLFFPVRNAAFSRDVIRGCALLSKSKIFTYTVYVNTRVSNALLARIIFKGPDGAILSTGESKLAAGDGLWHQLVVSGLSPAGACLVEVDLSNSSAEPVTAMIDDAMLLLHPGVVKADGTVMFQSPASLLRSP
jgi:hypothetical protein